MTRHSILKLAASLFAAVLTIASVAPAAQAQELKATVNIPFAFELGSHHFNAGRYSISVLNNHSIAVNGRSDSALAMTMWDSDNKPSTASKVVFHRYGNRYFLREVWKEGTNDYAKCVDTRPEMRAKKELQAQLASSAPQTSTVEVAMLGNNN